MAMAPDPPAEPNKLLSLLDYERAARHKLSAQVFGYYSSGADDEVTLRRNRADFNRFELRPRMLQGVREVNPQVTLFGKTYPWPVFVSPTAMQKLAHPDGELAMARAASETGATMILSTASTYPMEEIRAAGAGPMWFQLYCNKDPGVTKALVEKAEAAGFAALVLTADLPVLGNREIDQRNGFRMPSELQLVNLRAVHERRQLPVTSDTELIVAQFKPDLSFRDLAWLCGQTKLPVLVKGILRGDDAVLCLDHGAKGIFVSNHGGRQLDTAPGTISVLPEIVDAVAGRCPILLDSGVRRGTDVVKALALGANAVAVGRPPLWGLAVNGKAGAAHVLTILRDEVVRALHLCGAATLADLRRDMVRECPWQSSQE
jgi:4-hydroxymandelate oxidase